MKNSKLVLISILVLSFFGANAQQQFKDTVRVPCLYVTDSSSFKTVTGWLTKVTTFEMQFQQQQAAPNADSFTVRKVKTPVKAEYYERLYTLGKTWVYKPATVLAEFKNPYLKD